MKKLMLFCLLLCTISVYSEELRFVYIAHGLQTSIDNLVQELDGLQRAARDGVATIFYMSNEDRPYIAYYNLDGKRDSEIYNQMMGELQESSFHNTDALTDLDMIIKIMEKYAVGNNRYDEVTWKFYITQKYWDMYNESVIASSYFVLDIEKWQRKDFKLQIYYSGEDEMEINKDYPFGELNLCPSLNNKYELINL